MSFPTLHLCSTCFHEKESTLYDKCNDCSGLNWIISLVDAQSYKAPTPQELQEKYKQEALIYSRLIKNQRARPRRSNRLIEKQLYSHSINGETDKFRKLNKFYHELTNSTLKSIV